VGAVVLLGAAGGLLYWKTRGPAQPTTAQTTTVVSSAPPKREDPAPLFAPPPPPKLDDEPDAGADAGTAAPKNPGGAGPSPCACAQKGDASGALKSALSARGQSAYGCYKRALQRAEVSGSMTVSVQIGPGGQVCSASVVNDTVNSGEVTSCVLGRFRGQSFPPPSGGCVQVNIPISFAIKQ
jgi:TonB family protein